MVANSVFFLGTKTMLGRIKGPQRATERDRGHKGANLTKEKRGEEEKKCAWGSYPSIIRTHAPTSVSSSGCPETRANAL